MTATTEAPVLPPFTVTAAAVAALGELGAVRLDVEEGGCCGTFWSFTLADPAAVDPGDARYGCEGAWLLVSPAAAALMTGARLDHSARTRPPRFTVTRNLNLEHVCPCRRSFGRPWPGAGQSACRSYLPMPWDGSYEPPDEWVRRTGWRHEEA